MCSSCTGGPFKSTLPGMFALYNANRPCISTMDIKLKNIYGTISPMEAQVSGMLFQDRPLTRKLPQGHRHNSQTATEDNVWDKQNWKGWWHYFGVLYRKTEKHIECGSRRKRRRVRAIAHLQGTDGATGECYAVPKYRGGSEKEWNNNLEWRCTAMHKSDRWWGNTNHCSWTQRKNTTLPYTLSNVGWTSWNKKILRCPYENIVLAPHDLWYRRIHVQVRVLHMTQAVTRAPMMATIIFTEWVILVCHYRQLKTANKNLTSNYAYFWDDG